MPGKLADLVATLPEATAMRFRRAVLQALLRERGTLRLTRVFARQLGLRRRDLRHQINRMIADGAPIDWLGRNILAQVSHHAVSLSLSDDELATLVFALRRSMVQGSTTSDMRDATLILAELLQRGLIRADGLPSQAGEELFQAETLDMRPPVTGHVFQDPWSGDLWPRFVKRLDFAELERGESGFPDLMLGTRGKHLGLRQICINAGQFADRVAAPHIGFQCARGIETTNGQLLGIARRGQRPPGVAQFAGQLQAQGGAPAAGFIDATARLGFACRPLSR